MVRGGLLAHLAFHKERRIKKNRALPGFSFCLLSDSSCGSLELKNYLPREPASGLPQPHQQQAVGQ
jgi:hypothetical protein